MGRWHSDTLYIYSGLKTLPYEACVETLPISSLREITLGKRLSARHHNCQTATVNSRISARTSYLSRDDDVRFCRHLFSNHLTI